MTMLQLLTTQSMTEGSNLEDCALGRVPLHTHMCYGAHVPQAALPHINNEQTKTARRQNGTCCQAQRPARG
jgi:hypothetical protein